MEVFTHARGLTAFLATSICVLCSFVSASYNYNHFQYDQGVSQFTPDGRLLQVEYASRSVSLSSPIVVWKKSEDTTVVATMSSSGFQERLVIVPLHPLRSVLTTTASMKSRHEVALVGLSGVLSDSVSLLDYATSNLGSMATPRYFARLAADRQQQHAFGGGIRPYGTTLTVIGSNNPEDIFVTDPSGALTEVRVGDDGVWVMGEGLSVLRKQIDNARSMKKKLEVLLKQASNKKENVGSLEVVILSKTHGAKKLDADEIKELMK